MFEKVNTLVPQSGYLQYILMRVADMGSRRELSQNSRLVMLTAVPDVSSVMYAL